MRSPPRPRGERLLSWPVIARAYLFLGPLEALGALAAFLFVMQAGGWIYGAMPAPTDPLYRQATTACLAAIVLAQMVNLFVCRHPQAAAWRLPLRGNPLIVASLLAEAGLLLAIVYTELGNRLFGTVPLPVEAWLFALPFALLLGVAEELRKGVLRWARRRSDAAPARH